MKRIIHPGPADRNVTYLLHIWQSYAQIIIIILTPGLKRSLLITVLGFHGNIPRFFIDISYPVTRIRITAAQNGMAHPEVVFMTYHGR